MSAKDTASQAPEVQSVVAPSTDPVEVLALPRESQEPQNTTQPVVATPLTIPEQNIFEEQQKSSELVSKAQSFLESPELKERDPKSKAQYLADKGLSGDTIDELQQALASIPVVPPRTYPEALVSPTRSRLFDNLVTIYYFFTYAAGASAVLTWVYSKFVFPRWVKMIMAKRRLRQHQLGLLKRLTEELSDHRSKCLTPSMVAPSKDSKPVVVTQLQDLSSQIPPTIRKTSKQHTLQSLSDLTGYLSSQIHLTSALDAVARAHQLQMPGATAASKNEVHEQLKKDIRSLKGLLINRRTFMQGNSLVSTLGRLIGAGGAAGLASLKVLLDELHDYVQAGEIKVEGFEQREDVGGVWLAEPRPDPSKKKWPETPVYDSLTTNVPHPIMFFPSHLAPPSTPLFTGSQKVNSYMRGYVDKFELRKYIRFNAQVTSATWSNSIRQWKVIARPHQGSGNESVSHFDHLLVANGHYRHPFFPDVEGLEDWAKSKDRSYTHSIWYRTPDPYRNRDVLVIGGGRSGVDCSDEISLVARKTVHSVRSLGDQDFEHIIQRGAISHFTSDGFVHFKNGRREYVDRVIFATGYQYDCSFLTQLPVEEPQHTSGHLYNSRFHIYPLALHTFPLQAAFPPNSLAFIGLPIGITVFSLVEVQATLAIRQMTGGVSLDFNYELSQALKWNDELQKSHPSALEVARAWHKKRMTVGVFQSGSEI
ncbi:Flavin-containing monooxygenase FMO GS-OX3 [Rhizoctonia solani AG-1 IB]|uniref:Flavin-containing monooxygenase FMO GS-OX3 n=1 Tax=Thanatephorus cucumeris (strain AG1-IB / isolate 7/3/14) TaxID=1108050 RepID=M5BIC5_THACB|nr:Flavin-containing monooxygenase FMO GS-OX3 [Rhizoctonia solani AG-1 IB]